MTLPNVNEWMTSLSALQVVPPPPRHNPNHVNYEHKQNIDSKDGKEPSVSSLPAAYYEQRDDVHVPLNSHASYGNTRTSVTSTNNNERDQNGRESIQPAARGTPAKMRAKTSLSRKQRGDEVIISSTPKSNSSSSKHNQSSASSDTSSKQKSINKISNLLSASNNKTTHDNMIMVGTQRVYPRTLLQPTIHHNPATDLWITTIHTDVTSDATTEKHQKAFSFQNEKAARASAYANSPPILLPITSTCMLCDTSFSFLRRPKHCKNCGIVICDKCATRWNTKMLPETYTKNKSKSLRNTVRVCVSCDGVARRFQKALLMGRYDVSVEGYLTGNVNLRCPFVFKGEKEIMFPIHCAILGQSERLLRWLVDVQCCPIHLTSTANKGKKSYEDDGIFLPTLQTSKGRSVVDMAMEMKHVGILRYLVKEKGVSVHEVKELSIVLGALESMIMAFPEEGDGSQKEATNNGVNVNGTNTKKNKTKSPVKAADISKTNRDKTALPKPKQQYSMAAYSSKVPSLLPRDLHPKKDLGLYGAVGRYDSDEEKNDGYCAADSDDDCSVCTTREEMCMVCNEAPIDCVATPCGHQVCCLACSENKIACPSCKVVCRFIEIYQP